MSASLDPLRCTSGRFIEGLHRLGEQPVEQTCGRILTLLNGAKVCHHCDQLGRDPYAPISEVPDKR